jgi:mono/diheme cytochrome c family protein
MKQKRDGLSRAGAAVSGIAAAVVLGSGGYWIASAQEQGGAPPQQRDPTKVTVVKRAYDRQKLLSAPVLAEDTYRGRVTWLQRCAYCHDGVGQPSYHTMGSWLGAETVQTLTEPAIKAIIAAGTEQMPGFSSALKPQQVDDLIAFLKTVPASTKPTANQLAGRVENNTVTSSD